MKNRIPVVLLAAAVSASALPAAAQAAPSKAKKKVKTATVCRRGCDFSSIQKAVNRTKKGGKVRVKRGTYVEGVVVKGHKHDGLTIVGIRKKGKNPVLQGKGAKDAIGNSAQNGVFVQKADRVRLKNLTAKNYAGNGFEVRDCNGYLMKGLVAAFNRSYGLYAFNCKGGRMTRSTGYGHGDSAFYVGQTPPQKKPRTTSLDHLVAYENVLGYSGTNSRYVDIHASEFLNNGAGVVPNTLKSEKYAPSTSGVIRDNLIYWNNFNYFKPDSPVKPLDPATGGFNYPTGVGVVLFGTTGWKVTDNDIFGNFKWGVFNVSDPDYAPATNRDNQVVGNRMGAAGKDTNGADFMTEGSGTGNCWADNGAAATFDPGTQPQATLYPVCGSGNKGGGVDGQQLGEVAAYLLGSVQQESSWIKHPHPKREGRTPIDGLEG